MDIIQTRTFAMIKPDAVRRRLVGRILTRLEYSYSICRLEMMQATREQCVDHYRDHEGRPYFEDLVGATMVGPLLAVILEPRTVTATAVPQLRALMGSYKESEWKPGTIRGDYMRAGDSAYLNLIHGSDSDEAAARESAIWFNLTGTQTIYTC